MACVVSLRKEGKPNTRATGPLDVMRQERADHMKSSVRDSRGRKSAVAGPGQGGQWALTAQGQFQFDETEGTAETVMMVAQRGRCTLFFSVVPGTGLRAFVLRYSPLSSFGFLRQDFAKSLGARAGWEHCFSLSECRITGAHRPVMTCTLLQEEAW